VAEPGAGLPSSPGSPSSPEIEAQRPRVALALAGGAPEGAIYQIGALRALDEACDGLDLNHLFIYVGVSSGGFITACLANDLTTAQMCRAIVAHEPGEHPFHPETFLTPSVRQLGRGLRAVPRLLGEALLNYARHRADLTLLESLTRLGQALPVAVFDNEPIRAYIEKIFKLKSRTDDFRKLGKRLVIVAADLDSGQAVRFGEPGMDHIPISLAVQATTALPGLYPPVEIEGRHIVDGILLKTLHASVALDAGADLVICINPIVSVDTVHAVEKGYMQGGNLVERGLPTVLSQTLRTIVHSRLEVGMAAYAARYGNADVLLLEPERDDYLMAFTNIFGFSERRAVCEHAYQSTRRHLLAHHDETSAMLARHGVILRRDVLAEERDLWRQVGLPHLSKPAAADPRRLPPAAAPQAPPAPAAAAVVHRLDDALRRLEALVGQQPESQAGLHGPHAAAAGDDLEGPPPSPAAKVLSSPGVHSG
jgi:NTE family protein